MLRRTDLLGSFSEGDRLLSEPAVKIQGAMMKAIPSEYAEKLHISGYHPYSVYVFPCNIGYVIRLSALNSEAGKIISGMYGISEIKLYGASQPVKIIDRVLYDPVIPAELGSELSGKGCRLGFVTPAMIKTGGKPTARPDLPSYFYSVIQKYNAFENADILYSDFLDAWNDSEMRDYEFKCVRYNVSGHIFPGMTGFCEIVFPKEKKQADLLRRVFSYASYSGVGGKTGMGMGGFTAENL